MVKWTLSILSETERILFPVKGKRLYLPKKKKKNPRVTQKQNQTKPKIVHNNVKHNA